MFIYICIYIYICFFIYICIYIFIYLCIFVYVYVYMYLQYPHVHLQLGNEDPNERQCSSHSVGTWDGVKRCLTRMFFSFGKGAERVISAEIS